jgi:uncharacterized membrane protein (UPF0127 family)
MRLLCLCAAALLMTACEDKPPVYEANTISLTLPNGQAVRVEMMVRQEDMMKGMMFRDEMKPGHGMLFFHKRIGLQPYWMFQVKIPLDIIWLDANKTVVEMVQNAPPCITNASQCPTYGGKQACLYVLELAGGMAQKYGLGVGSSVSF